MAFESSRESSRIVVESREPATVVRFVDDNLVDSAIIGQVADDFGSLIASLTPGADADDAPPQIIIDMGNIQHFSSEALGMLITLNAKLKQAGGKLRLAEVSDELRQVFEITRVDAKLPICKTVNQALTNLKYLSQ